MAAPHHGKSRLRRYPGLIVLLVAGIAASLLPSSLLVPLSGPSASAELAPVPGRGDQAGDLSTLDAATTGGLGAGSGALGTEGGGAGGGLDQPGGGGGTGGNPRNKQCVGNPARQTGDPLSPPCVAYFDNDNGGATAKGVTRDQVTVVFYIRCTDSEAYEVDYAETDNPRANPIISAYWKHFNARYQTYGRKVRFIGVKPQCQGGANRAQNQAFIREIEDKHHPFALLETAESSGVSYGTTGILEEAARLRMVTLVPSDYRKEYTLRAPFWLSFAPDLENQDEQTAGFVCQQLAGFTASFSGNPDDRQRTRKFALLYEDDERRADVMRALDRRCGLRDVMAVSNGGQGAAGEVAGVDAMERAGITTVITLLGENRPTSWEPAAVARQWYPEWFVPGSITQNGSGRLHDQRAWSSAFTTFYRRRAMPLEQEPYYVAFREGCTDCTFTNNNTTSELYDNLTVLFWGIQAAGPRLTPESLDRGLHAIEPRPSPDPFTPAAYFAAGNYTWVKDAALAWWDPDAMVDGQRGCWRLAEAGRRYRAEDWLRAEPAIKQPDQPCQHTI
jgi:hypothetical protein